MGVESYECLSERKTFFQKLCLTLQNLGLDDRESNTSKYAQELYDLYAILTKHGDMKFEQSRFVI